MSSIPAPANQIGGSIQIQLQRFVTYSFTRLPWPALKADIELAFRPFPPSAAWSAPPDLRRSETIEKSHGRIESHKLEVTAALAGHLSPLWSGVTQVCRITRERIIRGKKTIETVHAITSLPVDRADPEQLLALSCAHWGIENCLHYVRDVSCREDQTRAHAGHAPQVLAACRNTALTLIRRLGFRVVEGFEHFAEHRMAAVQASEGREPNDPATFTTENHPPLLL